MKKRTKKILYYTTVLVLAAVFLYSSISLIIYFVDSKQSTGKYNELASMVAQKRPDIKLPLPNTDTTEPNQSGGTQDATEPTESPWVTITHPDTGEVVELLPEFADLFLLNPDAVGWISIDGTNINYPVVQTEIDNPNYYLNRNFDGKDSLRGCIYVNEYCNVFKPSDNVTIYGHRMNDDTMFGELGSYMYKSFWEKHQYIRFDTLQERHLYQVICVFSTSANEGEGFTYHRFIDARDALQFDAFVKQCQILSYYETGIDAEYGDKLITLSTCEYTRSNGRLVVVAKRVA